MTRKAKPTKRPPRTPKPKNDAAKAAPLDVPVEEALESEDVEENGESVDEMIEPDEEALTQDTDIDPDDDIFDLKKSPRLAAELSEDPVRLYLREIGQVRLLDVDSEFRLATLIEAERLIDAFSRRPVKGKVSAACGIYRFVMNELLISWDRLAYHT